MATTQTDAGLIPTTTIDLLDEDKPLRGQNYACVSFLSPEDVLANKDVFFFNRFLGSFASEMDAMLQQMATHFPEKAAVFKTLRENHAHIFNAKELQDQYAYFKSTNGQELESEFHAANAFRTSMRGIKIRGVFDTLKEAQLRAEVLKKMGDKMDIFVCQVGVWCPWSPNPEDLQDQQYAETQINTLMSEYKKNMQLKDEFFETRKKEKIDEALREKDIWTRRKEEEAAAGTTVVEEVAADEPSTSGSA